MIPHRRQQLAIATLALALSALAPAAAQSVPAVPKLDLNNITGTWFEQARLPYKRERRCTSDNTVLFALNDKKQTFQRGIFCRLKTGNAQSLNDAGKLDKSGNGILKVRHLVLFSIKLHVLATAPDGSWAILGTPNHKTLWLLTRTPQPDPAITAQMTRQAATAGFNTSNLIPVPRTAADYHPGDLASTTSQNPLPQSTAQP